MDIKPDNILTNKWNTYVHLLDNDDWSINGYHKLMESNMLNEHMLLSTHFKGEFMKNTLIFMMRENIQPIWEADENKNGGDFSFKINIKDIENAWYVLVYKLCLGKIFHDMSLMKHVTGISCSPKKNFYVVKIWMNTCKYRDTNIFNLQEIDISGSRFKNNR